MAVRGVFIYYFFSVTFGHFVADSWDLLGCWSGSMTVFFDPERGVLVLMGIKVGPN